MIPHRREKGFTLIELMIIVAILAVLMLIAVPKFGNLIRKANEAGTRGHLASIRSAIRLYYMEMEQVYPANFMALRQAGAKFINGSTPLYTGVHPVSDTVDDLPALNGTLDEGRWGYVESGPDLGHFWVVCTHEDSTGTPWSRY
jgi:prepilin-type N-terminal cleavage/methylation domain-containing protein